MPAGYTLNSSRGSVLILVTWIMLMLGLVTLAFGARTSLALLRTGRFLEEGQAYRLAESAVSHAISTIQKDTSKIMDGPSEEWGKPHTFDPQDPEMGKALPSEEEAQAMQDEAVIWRMEDEERKLPLNTAPAEALARLFAQTGGVRPDDAKALADAVIDWRDDDTDPQPNGAEDFYYTGLRAPYECKDAPFENVEELRLIKGMTDDVYARVAPYVTVFGSGAVNINSAREEVLHALGLTSKATSGILTYRNGPDGKLGTPDDRIIDSSANIVGELAPYVPSSEMPLLGKLVKDKLLDVGSTVFTVIVHAPSLHAGFGSNVRAVIDREGGVLDWEEE